MYANYSASPSTPSPRSTHECRPLLQSDGALAGARAHALEHAPEHSRASLAPSQVPANAVCAATECASCTNYPVPPSASTVLLPVHGQWSALERGLTPPGAAELVTSGLTADELEAHYCTLYKKVWATCISPAVAVVWAVNKLATPVAVVAEQYLVPMLCLNPKWHACDFAKALPTTLSAQYSFFMFVVSFVVLCGCNLNVDVHIKHFVTKCKSEVRSCCCLSGL